MPRHVHQELEHFKGMKEASSGGYSAQVDAWEIASLGQVFDFGDLRSAKDLVVQVEIKPEDYSLEDNLVVDQLPSQITLQFLLQEITKTLVI